MGKAVNESAGIGSQRRPTRQQVPPVTSHILMKSPALWGNYRISTNPHALVNGDVDTGLTLRPLRHLLRQHRLRVLQEPAARVDALDAGSLRFPPALLIDVRAKGDDGNAGPPRRFGQLRQV